MLSRLILKHLIMSYHQNICLCHCKHVAASAPCNTRISLRTRIMPPNIMSARAHAKPHICYHHSINNIPIRNIINITNIPGYVGNLYQRSSRRSWLDDLVGAVAMVLYSTGRARVRSRSSQFRETFFFFKTKFESFRAVVRAPVKRKGR